MYKAYLLVCFKVSFTNTSFMSKLRTWEIDFLSEDLRCANWWIYNLRFVMPVQWSPTSYRDLAFQAAQSSLVRLHHHHGPFHPNKVRLCFSVGPGSLNNLDVCQHNKPLLSGWGQYIQSGHIKGNCYCSKDFFFDSVVTQIYQLKNLSDFHQFLWIWILKVELFLITVKLS